MKKLTTLLFALMLTASMAFAQNNSDLTQSGTNNDANITQSASASGSNAMVNQKGSRNKTTLTQEGGSQTSDVVQRGTGNSTKIDQMTDNDGSQSATVKQQGKNNQAFVVSQFQTGGGNNTSNSAFIKQSGKSNYALQSENAPGYNGGQHMKAVQQGKNNRSTQKIMGGHTLSLEVNQQGTGNTGTQIVDDPTSSSDAKIVQRGRSNTAKQHLSGSNHGYYNDGILIRQQGTGNNAVQDLAGSQSSTKGDAQINQRGNSNDAYQYVNGNDYTLMIHQRGSDNYARMDITGAQNANIDQNGSGNTAHITQN